MISFLLFSLFDIYDANNVDIFFFLLLFLLLLYNLKKVLYFLNGANTFRQSKGSFSPFVQIDDFYFVLSLLGDYQTSIVVICCVVEFVLLDLL